MLENKKNGNNVQSIPRLSECRNHENEGKFEKNRKTCMGNKGKFTQSQGFGGLAHSRNHEVDDFQEFFFPFTQTPGRETIEK